MTYAIAIVPSNQDGNKAANGATEYSLMRDLSVLVANNLERNGHNVRLFAAAKYGLESKDTSHLIGLVRQVEAATKWIDATKDDVRVTIHLHSDAGNYAHVIGIYDGRRSYPLRQQSRQLATDISSDLQRYYTSRFAPCRQMLYDYGSQSYIFATKGSPKSANVLIETGSHEDAAMCDFMAANLADIAAVIASSFDSDRRYFPETGYWLAYGFKRYWEGVPEPIKLFGYPISNEIVIAGRTVQYFERYRMEYWPEDKDWTIKGSLLGRDAYDNRSA